MKNNLRFVLLLFTLYSCSSARELNTVSSVDLNQYEGKWYEIARLPNNFEEGLSCVTAEYTISKNIEVMNRGFDAEKGKWKSSKGKAKLAGPKGTSQLDVTFFWPFKGVYYIMDVTPDYEYALVGTPDRSYLWILSRSASVSESIKSKYLSQAKSEGFDTSKLIWVEHNCEE